MKEERMRLKKRSDLDAPGYLITLEGGDGAGKSTLLARLAHFFEEKGFAVLVTREPGGTELGEALRSLLLARRPSMPIGDLSELLLFLAARAEHIEEKILPALQRGAVVLCDRFNDSTIAYQGGARGLGVSFVRTLCQLVCRGVTADMTLLLDVKPEIGLMRAKAANRAPLGEELLDRIEAQEVSFHQKIRDIFLSLAQEEPDRIHLVDANGSQESVWRQTQAFIAARLGIDCSHRSV